MKNLLKPKWLLLVNTLPILFLFFMYYGQFNIIKTLLDEDSIYLWQSFAWALGVLGFLNFIYTIYSIIKKHEVTIIYSLIALIGYIVFIYLYSYYSNKIIPFSIPRWMISGNMFVYVGTFLMPTLVYVLLVLVTHFTVEVKEIKAWKNFSIAILIPIFWYVFSQVILPFWQPIGNKFGTHAILIFIIIGTLLFLFYLIRGVYIVASKKPAVWKKNQLVWKIPIAIVFPLLGLALNNGLISGFHFGSTGIFGDFKSYWFYVLAVVNGLLICLPNLDHKVYRLLLFVGRSITFAYTFYFFLVFLPFLPLSVVAIVAIGIGFLMLTPLLLFVIHINELSKDFTYLKAYLYPNVLSLIVLGSFLFIPLWITQSYLMDKRVLTETLDYIYTPDYSKDYQLDKASLQKTLTIVKHHKDKGSWGFFGSQTPYLSSYFNWIVLDNLTLSDKKINTIENVFFEHKSFKSRLEITRNNGVNITNIKTKSSFDKSQNAWISWIDLEITNSSKNNWFSEYVTTFELPDGCWINDYYLYVGDKKEKGILAEKKSAMWIFSQIRNTKRDPGILYYLAGNKVAFRVFPFAKNEVRKTGISFIHKEPIKLIIDGNNINLGTNQEFDATTETANAIYISSKRKKNLNVAHRKPYFHFLVDVSQGKDSTLVKTETKIERIIANNDSLLANAKISFVNTYVNTLDFDSNWQQNLENQSFEGGFYLDRAIKKTLVNAYQKNTANYPVLIVVSDSIQNAILGKNFADYKMTFPESKLFYVLQDDGKLQVHSLLNNPMEPLSIKTSYSFNLPVLEYKSQNNKTYYLANNNAPSIVLKNKSKEILADDILINNWESALKLQGMWNSQIMHPETSNDSWLTLVKYSFRSGVMMPSTSYLVVENEAQKAMLKKKQEQVLSSNKSLDLGEETQQMSEPNTIIVLVLLLFILMYKKKLSIKSLI